MNSFADTFENISCLMKTQDKKTLANFLINDLIQMWQDKELIKKLELYNKCLYGLEEISGKPTSFKKPLQSLYLPIAEIVDFINNNVISYNKGQVVLRLLIEENFLNLKSIINKI